MDFTEITYFYKNVENLSSGKSKNMKKFETIAKEEAYQIQHRKLDCLFSKLQRQYFPTSQGCCEVDFSFIKCF